MAKPWIVTDEVRAEVTRLARVKATNTEIAAAFNISIDTLDRHLRKDAALADQVGFARSQAVLDAKEVIWAALKGRDALKAAAIIVRFWGDGKERLEVSGDPANPLHVKESLARRTLSPDEARAILGALEAARSRSTKK